MGRKLAVIVLVVFVIVQLPFTVVAVMFGAGLLKEGPAYLLGLYDSLVGIGGAEPRGDSTASGPDAGTSAGARQSGVSGQELQTAEREPLTIEPLPQKPVAATADLKRVIGRLPVYVPFADLGQGLSGIADLAIDYVSLPARPGAADGPVRIRFRPLEGPRVLILAGRPGQSWALEGALPRELLAVLVVAPEAEGGEMLFGLPDHIPAVRLEVDRKATPFMLSALPDCRSASDPQQAPRCSNLTKDRATGEYRWPFLVAEDTLRLQMGRPIASVSAAFADDQDRLILVPEEVVDDTVRQRSGEILARYIEGVDQALLNRQTVQDYKRRWIEERRTSAVQLMTRHPAPVPSEIRLRHPRVFVVSAHQGALAGRPRATRDSRAKIASYQDYRKQEIAKVGTILVKVQARRPSVIVATASRVVDWRFELAPDAQVLAIHVEGGSPPTVTGVPRSVPLVVRSDAYGDRNVANQLEALPEDAPDTGRNRKIRADLARFQGMYRSSALTLYGDYTLEQVILTDSSDDGGALEQ